MSDVDQLRVGPRPTFARAGIYAAFAINNTRHGFYRKCRDLPSSADSSDTTSEGVEVTVYGYRQAGSDTYQGGMGLQVLNPPG